MTTYTKRNQISKQLEIKYSIEERLYYIRAWWRKNRADTTEFLTMTPLSGCLIYITYKTLTGGFL